LLSVLTAPVRGNRRGEHTKERTMQSGKKAGLAALAVLLAAGTGVADVFNMGPGRVSLETVPVGNANNAADTRYANPGFGSVGYTYSIGKFEVTAGQYTVFLNAVAGVDTYILYNGSMSRLDHLGSGISRTGGGTVASPYIYTVDAGFVNRPVSLVSWGGAARFANWLTNGQPADAQGAGTTETGSYALSGAMTDAALAAVTRIAKADRVVGKDYYFIPTEDEWYKAAYYDPATSSYYNYPTSSNDFPGCDLADGSGNNANRYDTGSAIQPPYYKTVVGEFQNSDSPYGTFDQGGNVWEWNEAVFDLGVWGWFRGLRGGSFNEYDDYLHALQSHVNYPSAAASAPGFRVSAVPEPGTTVLLATGGLGLALARRRRRQAA
jgi:formylglycine-generating enzyme required for sulfatase activity